MGTRCRGKCFRIEKKERKKNEWRERKKKVTEWRWIITEFPSNFCPSSWSGCCVVTSKCFLLVCRGTTRPAFASEQAIHIHFDIYTVFRASHFRCLFIWFQPTISQINRMSTAISLSNSLLDGCLAWSCIQSKSFGSSSAAVAVSFCFVIMRSSIRRNVYKRTCFKCFVSFVFSCFFLRLVGRLVDCMAFVSVPLLVLDIAFTFNAHRVSHPISLLCSLTHSLSISDPSTPGVRNPSVCLFALHYLYIYISAHKYRL